MVWWRLRRYSNKTASADCGPAAAVVVAAVIVVVTIAVVAMVVEVGEKNKKHWIENSMRNNLPLRFQPPSSSLQSHTLHRHTTTISGH